MKFKKGDRVVLDHGRLKRFEFALLNEISVGDKVRRSESVDGKHGIVREFTNVFDDVVIVDWDDGSSTEEDLFTIVREEEKK